jgi:hypothetical protein
MNHIHVIVHGQHFCRWTGQHASVVQPQLLSLLVLYVQDRLFDAVKHVWALWLAPGGNVRGL